MAGGGNLYAYAGNNPITFTDPFGLCPPADENYDDCSAGSPEWYANRVAMGQGNRGLNEFGGAFSTLARVASDHVQVSGTAGYKTIQMDAHAVASGGQSGSISTQVSIPASGVPVLGASVGLVIGDPTAGNGDSFHAVGISRHLGITITYDAANGGKPKKLEINLDITTPTLIPITAGGDTKVIQE